MFIVGFRCIVRAAIYRHQPSPHFNTLAPLIPSFRITVPFSAALTCSPLVDNPAVWAKLVHEIVCLITPKPGTSTYIISHVIRHIVTTCHMQHITCNMSHVTCHMSHVSSTSHVSSYIAHHTSHAIPHTQILLGQALKAGAEADFQLPSIDTPDDIVAGIGGVLFLPTVPLRLREDLILPWFAFRHLTRLQGWTTLQVAPAPSAPCTMRASWSR